MITFESASPGTSTPCQKLSAPKITLLTSALNASTIFDRGIPSLWREQGDVPLGEPGRQRPGRGVEHLVRREEHERLAVGRLQVVRDRLDRDPLELLGLARRGRAGSGAGGSSPGWDSRTGCPEL